jgi:NAD(P) transhydrogenase subunit alpha
MRVAVPKESTPGERRVAATPESVAKLIKMGFTVAIEDGAGDGAGFAARDYEEAGATIERDPKKLWAESDVVLKVRAPDDAEMSSVREGALVVSFVWPAQNEALLSKYAARKVTGISIDCVPRITRAQKMDALSSMANIAGYRAVVEAANRFGRFFTGQITAAGKVPPATVLVIGAGVAGLAAIGAARGLGAIVRAFDTRPAVKEQVESMGAEFLELHFEEEGEGAGGYAKVMSKEFIDAEMALFREQAQEVDIIITTALIPGKKAPVLITKDMVELMARGSVVVDLAAEQGGNCELTEPGEAVDHDGVWILGYTDLASRMAAQSSRLYANNLVHLLHDMGGAEEFRVDLEDEVVRGALVTHDGEITWPPPKVDVPATPPAKRPSKSPKSLPPVREEHKHSVERREDARGLTVPLTMLAAAVALTGIGYYAPAGFLTHLTVFVLACFVGWQVIWNVTPALHTPLMSVTNAISGIIIVGGMLHQQIGEETSLSGILGAIAILIASINVAGGFLVTQRMLRMFRRG